MAQAKQAIRQAPQKVIVNHNTVNEVVVVRSTVDLPEAIFDQYSEQAIAQGRSVEEVMSQRLLRTVTIDGNGLWFNAQQKKRLDHLCGHTIGDAEGAIQRLETVSKVKLGDVELELEPRLKLRLESRAKMQRKSLPELIKREVLLGLRRFAGLEPM